MALSGNRLGGKVVVQYVSDSGSTYLLNIDEDLIISNSGLVLGTVGGQSPKRFKPRGVHVQAYADGRVIRKFLICGTNEAALYATNTPQVVTIDGLAFTTSGRRGEVQSFVGGGVYPPPTPPTP